MSRPTIVGHESMQAGNIKRSTSTKLNASASDLLCLKETLSKEPQDRTPEDFELLMDTVAVKVPFFDNLPDPKKMELFKTATVKTFPPGATIWNVGDSSEEILLLLTGNWAQIAPHCKTC